MEAISTEIYENRDAGLIVPQWRFRPIATEGVVGWTQNTWYPVLDVSDALVRYVTIIKVGGVNETAEVRVTIDGNVILGTQVCVVGTLYYVFLDAEADTLSLSAVVTRFGNGGDWFGNSVLVEMRQTSNPGPTSFDGFARYWQL